MQQLLDLSNLALTPSSVSQFMIHIRLIAQSRAHPQPLPQLQPLLVLWPWRAHRWLQPPADLHPRGVPVKCPPSWRGLSCVKFFVNVSLHVCFDVSGLCGLQMHSHILPVVQPKTQKDYGKQWINLKCHTSFLKVWRTDGMSHDRAAGLQQCLQKYQNHFPGCCIIY